MPVGQVRASLYLFIGLFLMAPAAAGAASGDSIGSLTTPWPVDVEGLFEMRAGAGALFLDDPAGVNHARLVAERITIDHAWERGLDVGAEDPLYRHVQERDSETVVLDGVDVSFDASPGGPLVLAHSDATEVVLDVRSAKDLSLSPVAEPWLVQAGTAPDAAGALEAPELGYWYAFGGPGVRTRASGSYAMSGTFTIFVHDAVIHATGRDRQWSEWTGYRESDPGAPASEYELRITTLHVENGTLEGSAAESFDAYAPGLEAQVQGSFSSQGVAGRLHHGGKVHVFDGDPLRVEGKGSLRVGGEWENAGSWKQRVHLALGIDGAFEVFGAQTVGPDPGRRALAGLGFDAWFSMVGAVALGMGGLMVLGVVPGPTPRSRRRRHRHWMQKGAQAGEMEDWPRAVHCYGRAARLRRDEPLAWFRWAAAALENGDPETAEKVARQAAEVPGIDPADLLDLRAVAAWERGDMQAFDVFVDALMRVSPRMARGLRADLGLAPAAGGASSAGAQEASLQEGDLDGYA